MKQLEQQTSIAPTGGFELDSLGVKKLIGATDGDTPSVAIAIRMLSIDAPEKHFPSNQPPSSQDEKLAQLADWIKKKKAPIEKDLANYLLPRLTKNAGTLHGQQGNDSHEHLLSLMDVQMETPKGKWRDLFVRTSRDHFDHYGRLLAYISPKYSKKELESDFEKTKRATFNLMMVEDGWAVPFVIYPSVPSPDDLKRLQKAGATARKKKKGAWKSEVMLTGYEFRMVVRLYDVTKKAVEGKKLTKKDLTSFCSRYCADISTKTILPPQRFVEVAPENRLFIPAEHLKEATQVLGYK